MLELIETKKEVEKVLHEFVETLEEIVLENMKDDFRHLPKEMLISKVLDLPENVKTQIFNQICSIEN